MNEFVEAWKDAVMKNYANFSGRLSLGGYWRFFAANITVVIVLAVLIRISGIFLILYFVYALALLLPSLAAGVRRLHDTGKSGALILIGLIPIVGFIVLLVFFVQAGDPAPNAYGAPDGGPGQAAVPQAGPGGFDNMPPPPPPPPSS